MSVEGGSRPSVTSSERSTTPPIQPSTSKFSLESSDQLLPRGNKQTPSMGRGDIDDIFGLGPVGKSTKGDFPKPDGSHVQVFQFQGGNRKR